MQDFVDPRNASGKIVGGIKHRGVEISERGIETRPLAGGATAGPDFSHQFLSALRADSPLAQ